jgi:hypothetical protein
MKRMLLLAATVAVVGMSGAVSAGSYDDCVRAVEKKFEQCYNPEMASRHNVKCENKRDRGLARCDQHKGKNRAEKREEKKETAERIRERLQED